MKAVVSLSGGRDSCCVLAVAIEQCGVENVRTISFEYGSKHPQEIKAAQQIAEHYGVPWKLITIDPSIFEGTTSTLLKQSGKDVQLNKTYEEILKEKQGKVDTYVPARNTLFGAYSLAIAESTVQQFDEDVTIYLGQHADDSGFDENGVLDYTRGAYPDTSCEYVEAFTKVADISSVGRVHYKAPFVKMHKWELLQMGKSLGAPLHLAFSCYDPVKVMGGWMECEKCATDLDVQQACKDAGIEYKPTFLRTT